MAFSQRLKERLVDIAPRSTMAYQRSKHHVFLNNYHLIWCSKRRKPVLKGIIKSRFIQITEKVAQENKWKILALEVQPDHIHLSISTPPTIPAHKVQNAIKSRTSNILRKEFPELLRLPSLWARSYFSSTAGNVSSEVIRNYIEEQSKI